MFSTFTFSSYLQLSQYEKGEGDKAGRGNKA